MYIRTRESPVASDSSRSFCLVSCRGRGSEVEHSCESTRTCNRDSQRSVWLAPGSILRRKCTIEEKKKCDKTDGIGKRRTQNIKSVV